MNNHHLFLIRSDSVTQLAAHLVAGIIVLVLASSICAPQRSIRPDTVQATPAIELKLPAGTTVLAASTPVLR
ncbi:MAG TPA: hypothetical protein VG734_09180 [Lacunisphaera sp.]|nr:hypothetical protein [Lacunisphaera sp.]